MTVKVYLPDSNDQQQEALTAIADGIPNAEVCRVDEYAISTSPDIAVVFGDYIPSVPFTAFVGRVIECQKLQSKQTIIINNGFIKRGEYFSVGWHEGSFYNEVLDCPSNRFEKLGIELSPTSTGDHILICGQEPWSEKVYKTDHVEWMRQAVVKVQNLSDMNIRVRPHPDAIDNTPNFLGTFFSIGVPLEEDLAGAAAVITYNSNVGVDAVLAGKACFSFDKQSMVYGVSDHFFELINAPSEFDRQRWANNIAYAQWNLDEMKSGETWDHLHGSRVVAA